MSSLPCIAPRLVVHARDVADLLTELAAEHAALQAEHHALVLQLEALDGPAPNRSPLDERLLRAAARTTDELVAARRTAVLAELEAATAAGEQEAAERVVAAEAEMARLLDSVRVEVTDRLVGERHRARARLPEPPLPPVPAPTSEPEEEAAAAVAAAPTEPEVEVRHAGGWDTHDGGWDTHDEPDQFRVFWSEQDEVASIREAISAPLIAIAPMVLALLVIVLVLVFVV